MNHHYSFSVFTVVYNLMLRCLNIVWSCVHLHRVARGQEFGKSSGILKHFFNALKSREFKSGSEKLSLVRKNYIFCVYGLASCVAPSSHVTIHSVCILNADWWIPGHSILNNQ